MPPKRFASHHGFTLIELLIVIGIIAILMALLVPTLSRAREESRRAVCMSNLHNASVALRNYAQSHDDQLPVLNGGSRWLWDIPTATRDALLASGMTRHAMYCPSGDMQDSDDLWNYQNGGYTVTGYFWLTQRLDPAGPKLIAPKVLLSHIHLVRHPEETEVVTDATISENGNFTGVHGGWAMPHRTNHLRTGRPAGGNILFLDGHAEWRDFTSMQIWCQPGNDEWF